MKKIVSLVLALIMVLGMAVPAFAAAADIKVNNATYYENGSLKSLATFFRWTTGNATSRLVLMTERLRSKGEAGTNPSYGDFTNFGYYGSSFDNFDEVLSHDKENGTFGIVSYSDETNVKMSATHSITFNFNETDIPLNKDETYYVYLWTYYSNNYYPDNLFYVINVKDGVAEYTPATGTNTYDETKFEVVESVEKFDVKIIPAENMTKKSGEEEQNDLTGAITNVVYEANDGYYFPEDYEVASVNGISVTRNSETQITVSGKPSKDTEITLVAPTKSTTTPAPQTYTVTYYDEDGDVVYTETVNEGEGVQNIPAVPATAKEGYDKTQPEWDHDGQNIIEDTEINPVYFINTYIVTYYDEDGVGIWEEEVAHGANVQDIPEVPATKKEGYDQTQPEWDHDGQNITEDTEINPVYTINEYLVNYIAFGRIVDEQNVKHGEDAVAPEVPLIVLWNHDGKNITEDTDIYGYSIFGNGRPAGSEEVEEDGEQNPSTGAPVFAPAVIVLSAVASFLGKRK